MLQKWTGVRTAYLEQFNRGIVLGYSLQKKSFRRRFEDAGILTDTGESKIAGKRPAKLYSLGKAASDHIFPRPLELRDTK